MHLRLLKIDDKEKMEYNQKINILKEQKEKEKKHEEIDVWKLNHEFQAKKKRS